MKLRIRMPALPLVIHPLAWSTRGRKHILPSMISTGPSHNSISWNSISDWLRQLPWAELALHGVGVSSIETLRVLYAQPNTRIQLFLVPSMPQRRSHTKSRRGCIQCKQRHVKVSIHAKHTLSDQYIHRDVSFAFSKKDFADICLIVR